MRSALAAALLSGFLLGLGSATALAQATFEVNVDRPGSDYRNFELWRGGPRACQEACFRGGPCRAWTYVRAGYQGPAPRCWLKLDVPPSTPSPCCVSGVVP